jgi:hypothetical protein
MKAEYVSRTLRAHGSAGNTPAASGFVTPPLTGPPFLFHLSSRRSQGPRWQADQDVQIRHQRERGGNIGYKASLPLSPYGYALFFFLPSDYLGTINFREQVPPNTLYGRCGRNHKEEIKSHDCIAPAAPTGLDGSCLRRAAPSKARNERRRRHLALFPGQKSCHRTRRIQRDLPHGWQLGTRGR